MTGYPIAPARPPSAPTERAAATASSSRDPIRVIAPAAFLLFACVLLINAWVVDDAYITFRTVDNFIHGYGLTWNVDERVQAYTHPLWMLVMTAVAMVTGEVFFTSIALSLIFTMAAVIIVAAPLTRRFSTGVWRLLLLLSLLVASKAFIDYASSGLETALGYLLAAIFFRPFLDADGELLTSRRAVRRAFFWAALAFVNRQDSILIFVPALLYVLVLNRSTPIAGLAADVALATIPATAWTGFSLFYYGFPFPNTAYAKGVGTGFPQSWKTLRGIEYALHSVRWDPASHVAAAVALAACVWRRARGPAAAMLGALMYAGFTIVSLASSTHMAGRHFALPFFVAASVLATLLESPPASLATVLLAIFIAWSPVSSIKFGTSWYTPYPRNDSFVDVKWFVWREGAALLNWRPGREMPIHPWFQYGREVGVRPERVFVGGAYGREPIGYTGYAAGPGKFFIDVVALSDPLLARLPALRPATIEAWQSGHFHRPVPAGYVESVARNTNLIEDERIRAYYDVIRLVTRGPLFSLPRLKAIAAMNLGAYRRLPHAGYAADEHTLAR